MMAAIVPAAGLSSRMGRPKPLLEIGGRRLVVQVINALMLGGVEVVVVITPPRSRVESAEIALLAQQNGATVVIPDHETVDMRATIELGLDEFDSQPAPDAILICPVDTPGVGPDLIRRLINQSRSRPEAIIVPVSSARRGHPILLPMSIAMKIRFLQAGTGIKCLLNNHPENVVEVACNDDLDDIDTPEEYRRWMGRTEV